MFNVGSAELAIIAVAALLILGPKRLPELARSVGKFMREFRRQTDEVRNVVEREFYRMDEQLSLDDTKPVEGAAPSILPAEGTQPTPEALASGEPVTAEPPQSSEPAVAAVADASDPVPKTEVEAASNTSALPAPSHVEHQGDDAIVPKKEIA